MASVFFNGFAWSAAQEFSVWTRYDLPAHERRWNSVTEERAIPDHVERVERNLGRTVRLVPRHKDGFYMSSQQLSAAVGIVHDPTAIMELTGEGRAVTMLHHLYDNAANSRGWLSFEISYRLGGELKRKKLAQLDRIELKRVRRTAMLVTEMADWDIEIVFVDFVPKEPDGNVFLRSISARTPSSLPIADVKLHCKLHRDGMDWQLGAQGPRVVARNGSGLMGIAGHGPVLLRAKDDEITLKLERDSSGPGMFAGTLALTAGSTGDSLARSLEAADAAIGDVAGAAGRTMQAWQDWHRLVPIRVEGQRAQDFIDGALTLLKCLEGPESIRLGTMIYEATSAYVRDNWWIARALLAGGRIEEAKKSQEFFYRATERFGIQCAYKTNDPAPPPCGGEERGVELPSSLTLMWKDLAPRIGADATSEYELIKRMLSTVELTGDGRQVYNTDEGWSWTMDLPDVALVTENSLLLIEAMEYAAGLARDAGDREGEKQYSAIAKRARAAIRDRHFDAKRGYYRYAMDHDDMPYGAVATTAVSSLVNHGFGSAVDKRIYSSLLAAWKYCRRDGMLTSSTATATVTGFTPGQYLQAIADLNLPFAENVLDGMWRMVSATGNLWEGYELYDYSWSGERQRAWDIAVGVVGLLRQVFGITVQKDSITFHPHLLSSVGRASMDNFRVGADAYEVRVGSEGMVISRNGTLLLKSDRSLMARFTGQMIELTPQFPMFPVRKLTPIIIDIGARTVTAGHWPGPVRVELPQLGLSVAAASGKVKISGRGWRAIAAEEPAQAQIDFVVTDPEFAPSDAAESQAALRVCGWAFDRLGAPAKRVTIDWRGQRQEVACDERGAFMGELCAGVAGRGVLTVSAGESSKSQKLTVGWHVENHADELIGFSAPAAMIESTDTGHDAVVAMCLLRHKGFLPKSALPRCAVAHQGGNIIRFARTLPGGAIHRGDNYVLLRRGQRYEFVIRKGDHAWWDTLGFVTDMRLWTTPLHPRALNRHFDVMEIAERLGLPIDAAPRAEIGLEISADRPMNMDVQGVVRRTRSYRTKIDPAKMEAGPIKGAGDYVAVRLRPSRRLRDCIHNAVFGLEYETIASQPARVELAFTFPAGFSPSTLMWGKLWERTLDKAGIEHNADGSWTLRHTLHPGRCAYRKSAQANFPINETFPLTGRNVNFEFARLLP
jgi:hypothetical protein